MVMILSSLATRAGQEPWRARVAKVSWMGAKYLFSGM
jgi:hypothetical protein